jgi:hypothetical protein
MQPRRNSPLGTRLGFLVLALCASQLPLASGGSGRFGGFCAREEAARFALDASSARGSTAGLLGLRRAHADSKAPRVVGNTPLRIDATGERMRVDGALKEWKGARFSELGSGDDTSLRFALATADQGLYIAAELRDAELVTGDQGDALVLTIQMPDGDALVTSELTLLPGEAGKSQARALFAAGTSLPGKKAARAAGRAAKPEPSVLVVEGPRDSGPGYVIEAFMPWKLVRGAEIWEQGRASLRLVDVDGPRDSDSIATALAQDGTLPRFLLGQGNQDLLGSFVQEHDLIGVTPRYDLRANVSGDARQERVVVIDRYVAVYGPGYKEGTSYNYFTLPYGVGGALIDAVLIDLTNDGRAELATRVRQQNPLGKRELWFVLTLAESSMEALFSVELKKELKGGFVENTLSVAPAQKGQPRRIDVKVGRALGLDANTYREAPATDAEPILLPWGEVAQRSYAYDGKRFAVLDEVRRQVPLALPGSAPKEAERARALTSSSAGAEEPTPADVLSLFKTQAKLPSNAKPSRTLRANVLGGSAPEQIDVFGSTLLFTGPDVAHGTGYLAYAAPISDARALLDVSSADLTGDGVAEVLLRVQQELAGAENVVRELLLVLRGDQNDRIARTLSVEVSRRQHASRRPGGDRSERAIENHVVVQKGVLRIEPGTATGWTEKTYPFTPDAIPGSERLLLPWRDKPVSYRASGAVLVAQ